MVLFFDVLDDDLYYEDIIENYEEYCKVCKKIHVSDNYEIEKSKNLGTKCFFGSGSYPTLISPWELKTNSLLYDTFIFDFNVFSFYTIGPFISTLSDLSDKNAVISKSGWVDLNVSSFLLDLYKNGFLKLVESKDIWNNMFDSKIHKDLSDQNKLYRDEIQEIVDYYESQGDKISYPGIYQMINEDILVSYSTNSSIITREYAGLIKRKINEYDTVKSKYNVLNSLLKYEVPNFDSLNYSDIYKIRKLKCLSKLRSKIEESSLCMAEDGTNVKETVNSLAEELWKLALDNIQDDPTEIIVENLISNLPVISQLISAKNLKKINQLKNHWGYTIFNLKKLNYASNSLKEKYTSFYIHNKF